jgi:hypothetical protein
MLRYFVIAGSRLGCESSLPTVPSSRFMEDRVCRFPRTRLPRAWVNEGKKKGRMVSDGSGP